MVSGGVMDCHSFVIGEKKSPTLSLHEYQRVLIGRRMLDCHTGFSGALAKRSGRMGNLYDWPIHLSADTLLQRKSDFITRDYCKIGGNTLDLLF